MFLRLFGEGEVSEKSRLAWLHITGATKATISPNWKERSVYSPSITIKIKNQKRLGAGSHASGVMPEPLPVSSASSIARMAADVPVLAITAS
jgi:hypothetical protein